jgi:hypothetical protein
MAAQSGKMLIQVSSHARACAQQAVSKAAGAPRWMANHRNAKLPCALFDRFKDGRRYVVGVDINRHGVIHKLAWRTRDRVPTA